MLEYSNLTERRFFRSLYILCIITLFTLNTQYWIVTNEAP